MKSIRSVLLFFSLSACGLGLVNYLDEFSIHTNEFDSNNNAALSPVKNQGEFQLEWRYSIDEEYVIGLYVEREQFVSLKNHPLFEQQCEADTQQALCQKSVSASCKLNLDFIIECQDLEFNVFEVTTAIEQLPATAYLHLEICGEVSTQCDRRSIAVTFYRQQLIDVIPEVGAQSKSGPAI